MIMAAIADMNMNVNVRDFSGLVVSANALIAALAPKPILSNAETSAYLTALELLEFEYKWALTVTLEIDDKE